MGDSPLLGRCRIIDHTGCEWLLHSSQWRSTGCVISAATTTSLSPYMLDAIYSPNPDLLSGKSGGERKKTQQLHAASGKCSRGAKATEARTSDVSHASESGP
ncbi:hypothetical protein JOB18_025931 [Solea senegalensis]|uniref:Uncharacterized protein n=1 Tax=Solea senegalensis TaxID=28829 RepID=A0AAV6RBS3_SOLSE|nr:hypothetical protein JOB18_025931 [Solea senegalensis]